MSDVPEVKESITIPEIKQKNPGRVAWGKKLAKVSKELKIAKKKGETDIGVKNLIKKDIKIDKETKKSIDYQHIEMLFGFGGLAIAIITLYFQYKSMNVQHPQ